MKRREDESNPDAPVAPPGDGEERSSAAAEPEPPAEPAQPQEGEPAEGGPQVQKESTGLEGVDAQPLPPLTREEIEALRRERDELRDQLLRRRADFENYRKRVERDRHQAGLDAVAAVFRSLIPTLDNLERALEAASKDDPLREGVELIQRELLATLEAQGVVVQDPTGQRFDPQTQQALSHEVAPGFEEGTVVEVFRKGYFFRDRLLRPALVRVAKGGDGPGTGEKEPETVH